MLHCQVWLFNCELPQWRQGCSRSGCCCCCSSPGNPRPAWQQPWWLKKKEKGKKRGNKQLVMHWFEMTRTLLNPTCASYSRRCVWWLLLLEDIVGSTEHDHIGEVVAQAEEPEGNTRRGEQQRQWSHNGDAQNRRNAIKRDNNKKLKWDILLKNESNKRHTCIHTVG